MKTVVIAAGYATRLGELTKNFPKPLLKIGSNTILGRMLDDIDTIPEIDEHIIVTNHKFAGIFSEWAAGRRNRFFTSFRMTDPCHSEAGSPAEESAVACPPKPITIIDDGTESNETRLGAVRDLLYAIEKLQLDDDLLVVAADNVLEFSFRDFVDFARAKGSSCIMCHHEPEIWKLQRTGVIEAGPDMRVLQMQEKPELPVSHWAVPPFYIYLRKDLGLVRHAVENGCGTDAPGNLAHYMVDKTVMYAWPMNAGRFDIGSLDTYYEAIEKYG